MTEQQKSELKKYLVAKETVKILWYGASSRCSVLEPEEILMVVDAFEAEKKKLDESEMMNRKL